MVKKYLKRIIVLAIFFSSTFLAAQTIPPGPANRPPRPPGRQAPIDGGITALLVLGAGYAIKKINDQTRK